MTNIYIKTKVKLYPARTNHNKKAYISYVNEIKLLIKFRYAVLKLLSLKLVTYVMSAKAEMM